MAAYHFYTPAGKVIVISESVSFGDTPEISDSDALDILDYIQTNLGVATTVSYAVKDNDSEWFIEP